MFTGIIETVGEVVRVDAHHADRRMVFDARALDVAKLNIGDSISVNGACLTIAALHAEGFVADVSPETMSCTTLGDLVAGDAVNLERSLTPSSSLGGHLVSGHVDAKGGIERRHANGRSTCFEIAFPASLACYICRKGSICVDGVSLTVNAVDGGIFSVNVIPHTMENTILARYQAGRCVNLEVDLIARYVESIIATQWSGNTRGGSVS